MWLLLKVFASGCTALTGVEAVSNGVKAFREPGVKNAQRTLTVIIFVLGGVAGGNFLPGESLRHCRDRSRRAGVPEHPFNVTGGGFWQGYFLLLDDRHPSCWCFRCRRTPLSRIFRGSAGPSRKIITCRTCLAIADAGWSTRTASWFWRFLCGALLIVFGGVTDRLIPLYAVGAFLAFTLSQSGMVMHWRKKRGPHWVKSAMVNGLGATGYRHHRFGGAGGEVRRGRLDHRALHSGYDLFFPFGSPALPRREVATSCPKPIERRRAKEAAHRHRTDRPLEQHHTARAGICRTNFAGNDCVARGAQRTFRVAARGMGTIRGPAVSRSGRGAAKTGNSSVAVSFRDHSGGAVCSGDCRRKIRTEASSW